MMGSKHTPEDIAAGKGPFTGKHMLAIMLGFFGVIIAVNLFMAFKATSTFGGTVVENSYVASQQYNKWLAEARAQKALGWSDTVTRRADGKIMMDVRGADGAALAGAQISATAQHPLGRLPERKLGFDEITPGHFISRESLPAGRWQLQFVIEQAGQVKHVLHDIDADA